VDRKFYHQVTPDVMGSAATSNFHQKVARINPTVHNCFVGTLLRTAPAALLAQQATALK
jgi:hypothetical protein